MSYDQNWPQAPHPIPISGKEGYALSEWLRPLRSVPELGIGLHLGGDLTMISTRSWRGEPGYGVGRCWGVSAPILEGTLLTSDHSTHFSLLTSFFQSLEPALLPINKPKMLGG